MGDRIYHVICPNNAAFFVKKGTQCEVFCADSCARENLGSFKKCRGDAEMWRCEGNNIWERVSDPLICGNV